MADSDRSYSLRAVTSFLEKEIFDYGVVIDLLVFVFTLLLLSRKVTFKRIPLLDNEL